MLLTCLSLLIVALSRKDVKKDKGRSEECDGTGDNDSIDEGS